MPEKCFIALPLLTLTGVRSGGLVNIRQKGAGGINPQVLKCKLNDMV